MLYRATAYTTTGAVTFDSSRGFAGAAKEMQRPAGAPILPSAASPDP